MFAWTESPELRVGQRGPEGPQPDGWRIFAHLRNASPLPIRNIEVQYNSGSSANGPAIEKVYLGPDGQGDWETFLPGGMEVDPSRIGAVFVFNDADGRRWRLNLRGRPEEWQEEPRGWVVVRDVPGRQ